MTPNTSSLSLSFLWLEITSKCNLECLHCYANSSPREDILGRMTLEKWLGVLSDSAALGCRQVQFIGGEPTLHPNLSEMIAYAASTQYTFIEVFTNATCLDELLLATIKDHGVHVAVSFYSDKAAVHDSITRHPGSFYRTVNNLKKLNGHGIPLRVGIIETSENIGDTANAKLFLEHMGISEITVDVQRRVGRGAGFVEVQDPLAELCGECSKGKLCVTASAEIFPCVFSRFAPLGTVESGIQDILTSGALSEFCTALDSYAANKALGRQQVHHGKHSSITTSDRNCGPDVICSPDLRCDPNCVPGSSKCLPVFSCNPEARYEPTERYAFRHP